MNSESQVRTFVAVLISADLKRKIARVQEDFKKVAPKVKWVDEENFHITLKFLGGVESSRVNEIRDALINALADTEQFDIEIGGAGAFPGSSRPRTVWIGVTSGGGDLSRAASLVEDALEKLGFPKEDRPSRSHITIGRVKDGWDARELGPALQEAEVGNLGGFSVKSVALMKSELKREGPTYTVLSEIPLREKREGAQTNG